MEQHKRESEINPEQADEIIMAGGSPKERPGYRLVSMAELRKLYGLFMNPDNMHMPIVQCLGMMLDVVRVMTHYKGVHTSTLPLDAWVYQEIVWERRPTVIVEIGNQSGGGAMVLRDILMNNNITDARGIIGIDINRDQMSSIAWEWPDIKWITGDACSQEVLEQVKDYIRPKDRVMIIDDSSHEYKETYTILENFSPLVTKNQYFIVEDTVLGSYIEFGKKRKRAFEAVNKFMSKEGDFVTDRNREKWFLTLNPGGYLLKIR
jgi:cephalosporin hydroxylase